MNTSINRILAGLKRRWWAIFVPIRLKQSGLTIGRDVQFYGHPILTIAPGSSVLLGDSSVICSSEEFTALGVSRRTILRTMSPESEISIGKRAGMSGATICANTRIQIGDECLIGADVMIVDTDFHPIPSENRRFSKEGIKSAPIVIGRNVFIGARSVILKGVTIGDNSVIAAGSVVSRSVPENCIAGGNPAKPIRNLIQ